MWGKNQREYCNRYGCYQPRLVCIGWKIIVACGTCWFYSWLLHGHAEFDDDDCEDVENTGDAKVKDGEENKVLVPGIKDAGVVVSYEGDELGAGVCAEFFHYIFFIFNTPDLLGLFYK